MPLVTNDSSLRNRLPEPLNTAPVPTATQTAAKWAAAAVDPRNGARLLGRTSVALAALALQLPRAAATSSSSCWEYKNFQSPAPNPEQFAIYTGCGSGNKFEQDFIDQCGAETADRSYPLFWHSVKKWSVATLYSHSHNPVPSNSSFIPCLLRVGGADAHHEGKVDGIIAGSIIGAVVVLAGVAITVKCCCWPRRGGAKEPRDVEMGHAVPAPLVVAGIPLEPTAPPQAS